MMRRIVVIVAGVGILLALAVVLGVGTGVISCHLSLPGLVAPDEIPADVKGDFRLMAEAWNTIQSHYVDRASLQPKKLTYGAISGMVDSLGDTGHSVFLTPKMITQERDFQKNKLEGIGAEVQMKSGHVVIVAPLDNSPASRAGLRPGDIILKVNGENIVELPLPQVVDRITGPPGTSVTLTIMTPVTGRIQDIALVRQAIRLDNVTWLRLPDTTCAHVRIASFSQDVSEHLRKALETIKAERLTGMILDLRNNPGGLLDEVIHAASQFLAGGNVLLEKNAKDQVTSIPVLKGGSLLHLPIVVLVNGGTASAAEIMAGALKDARRATLVGETTFGTGTVLKQFDLSDGSALLIATEEWLTPSGQTIWHKGITPDVVLPLPPDVSPTFPLAERGMTFAELHSGGDAQLLRALDLLVRAPGIKE
jgi:carboxyl-terminal processing protease